MLPHSMSQFATKLDLAFSASRSLIVLNFARHVFVKPPQPILTSLTITCSCRVAEILQSRPKPRNRARTISELQERVLTKYKGHFYMRSYAEKKKSKIWRRLYECKDRFEGQLVNEVWGSDCNPKLLKRWGGTLCKKWAKQEAELVQSQSSTCMCLLL
jgi:hypothetical protein